MITTAQISLGSNLGDRSSTIASALESLHQREGVSVVSVSSFREYPAIGGPPDQPAFLNAAATVETALSARELMHCLMEAERQRGRSRSIRWQARTLDIDLILFGSETIDEPGLEVPHPRFALRPFVLAPLNEIAPNAIDPLTRRTVSELLTGLRQKPPHLVVLGAREAPSSGYERISKTLEAEGWIVKDRPHHGTMPTLVAILPDHNTSASSHGPGTLATRWNSALQLAFPHTHPQSPTCPIYWPEPIQQEDAVNELLAICRGITNT